MQAEDKINRDSMTVAITVWWGGGGGPGLRPAFISEEHTMTISHSEESESDAPKD